MPTINTITLKLGTKVPAAIYTASDEPVCIVDSMQERSDDKAVAARIVACWNACQGAPTDALHPAALADAWRLAASRLDQMEADRKQALRWRDMLTKFSTIMASASDWPDTNAEREALERLVKQVRSECPQA